MFKRTEEEAVEYAIPTSVPAMRAALAYHEKTAEQLRILIKIQEDFNPNYTPDPTEYAGLPIAAALKKELGRHSQALTLDECLANLLARGCNLGERQMANMRTAITRNPALFRVQGNRVALTNSRERAA